FVSHDSTSLHNYISQFTAEEYRTTVGHLARPPSRTSSECLPLDQFTEQNPSFETVPRIPSRATGRPRFDGQTMGDEDGRLRLGLGDDSSSTDTMKEAKASRSRPDSTTLPCLPDIITTTYVDTTQIPPIIHETEQEQRTE